MEQRYVSKDGKWQRKQLEVDFVINEGSQKYYIQSALAMPDEEKRKQEIASLLRIGDSFKKIIIVKDDIKPWTDENGILKMGLMDFLMGDKKDLNIKDKLIHIYPIHLKYTYLAYRHLNNNGKTVVMV